MKRWQKPIIGIGLVLCVLFLALLNSHGLLREVSIYSESEPVIITGTVVDSETGKPVSKAKLGGAPDGWTMTKTNSRGNFTVEYEMTPDWFEATIDKSGYEQQDVEVPIRHYFGKKLVFGRHLDSIRLKKVN